MSAASFSNDSKKVVTGSHDRSLKFWDLVKGGCIKTSICFSSCNDLDIETDVVISAHFDGLVRIWDMRSGNMTEDVTVSQQQQQITSVNISPDTNYFLTNCKDGVLKIFDSRKHAELFRYTSPDYKNTIGWNKACFSPDGKFIAVGSSNGSVLVWDVQTQKLESTLRGHR